MRARASNCRCVGGGVDERVQQAVEFTERNRHPAHARVHFPTLSTKLSMLSRSEGVENEALLLHESLDAGLASIMSADRLLNRDPVAPPASDLISETVRMHQMQILQEKC